MSEYTEQAEKFLKDTGTEIRWEKVGVVDRFPNALCANGDRMHYAVIVQRGDHGEVFDFYGSIIDLREGRDPSNYDFLSCVSKDAPYGDVWEFAAEYGYDIDCEEDYERVERIRNAVAEEARKVNNLWGDVMEQLWEIS
jgi:hypothetical protein